MLSGKRLWKNRSRESFSRESVVLPAVRSDTFHRARAKLCLNFSTRCHVQRIQSSQTDSRPMSANQRARLAENSSRYLNHLHSRQDRVKRSFGGGKTTRSTSVLKRQPCLAFDRSNFAGVCLPRADDCQRLSPTRIPKRDRDKDRRIKVNHRHRLSRSSMMAPTAADESPLSAPSFSPASGRGLGPGRTRPAATKRWCGLTGIGVIRAPS